MLLSRYGGNHSQDSLNAWVRRLNRWLARSACKGPDEACDINLGVSYHRPITPAEWVHSQLHSVIAVYYLSMYVLVRGFWL